jgi:hypothetical protein
MLVSFSLRAFLHELIPYVFQTVLFLVIAILVWAIAALWGEHHWALILRLVGLGTLLVSVSRTLGALFMFLLPFEMFLYSWGASLIIEFVPPFAAILCSGFYLRLSKKETLYAVLVFMGLVGNLFGFIVIMFPVR